MRGMKITVDAAMRARDVSKPRAEHEALAQEAEAVDPKPEKPEGPAPAGAARPGQGRRRRRGRNYGRLSARLTRAWPGPRGSW